MTGPVSYSIRRGRWHLTAFAIGVLALVVALSPTVRSIATVGVLALGPGLAALALLAHVTGLRPIDAWHRLFAGLIASALVCVLAVTALLLPGLRGLLVVLAFAPSMLAGVAAVIAGSGD